MVPTCLHQHSNTQLTVSTGLHQHSNTQLMVTIGLHQHSNTQLTVSTGLHQHSNTQLRCQLVSTSTVIPSWWCQLVSTSSVIPSWWYQLVTTSTAIHSCKTQRQNTEWTQQFIYADVEFHLLPAVSALTWWVLLCVTPSDVTTKTYFWVHVELELVGLYQNFQPCFGHAHPWPPWPCDKLVIPTLHL